MEWFDVLTVAVITRDHLAGGDIDGIGRRFFIYFTPDEQVAHDIVIVPKQRE